MQRTDNFTISDFYCVECGQKGISLPRKPGQQREAGHLKKLWCLNCRKEQNFAEIRQFGSYTYKDFKLEFDLGRFVDGNKVPIADLIGCTKEDCDYNVSGKCWNASHSFECGHRPLKEQEAVNE